MMASRSDEYLEFPDIDVSELPISEETTPPIHADLMDVWGEEDTDIPFTLDELVIDDNTVEYNELDSHNEDSRLANVTFRISRTPDRPIRAETPSTPLRPHRTGKHARQMIPCVMGCKCAMCVRQRRAQRRDEYVEEVYGLNDMVDPMISHAKSMIRIGNVDMAMYNFKLAIEIRPGCDCCAEYAELLEDNHNYVEAEKYYKIAIEEYGHVVAMYNLAEMYYHMELNGMIIENDSYIRLALHYFEMAIQEGDWEALEVTIALAHKYNYVSVFARNYTYLLQNSRDYNCTDENDRNNKINKVWWSFANNHNQLTVLDMLNEWLSHDEHPDDAINPKRGASWKSDLNDCVRELEKRQQVTRYKNKVALFTKLNHVIECGICYDEKLNIDLECGHCVCTECYKRVCMSKCPFCRTGFASNSEWNYNDVNIL